VCRVLNSVQDTVISIIDGLDRGNIMQYIESKSTDPSWNLALEEFVFSRMNQKQSYFMLWQNHNTIVVGKNQNTVAEINTRYVRENGITVVRRLSGGGAVYHDLGNLNFTFVTDSNKLSEINFSRFCMPVIEALRAVGIHAELNGRNDMTIGGKKFSGNSQYIRNGRVLHHGTLLFKSNLQTISNALRVNEDKIVSKGIASVASRVTNISDYLPEEMTLERFKRILLQKMFTAQIPEPYAFSEEEFAVVREIQMQRYENWEWNYGYSPQYIINKRRRIEGCGEIEISLDIKHGRIQAAQFLGDFFSVREVEELAERLKGCPNRKESVEAILPDNLVSECIRGLTVKQLASLIADD